MFQFLCSNFTPFCVSTVPAPTLNATVQLAFKYSCAFAGEMQGSVDPHSKLESTTFIIISLSRDHENASRSTKLTYESV